MSCSNQELEYGVIVRALGVSEASGYSWTPFMTFMCEYSQITSGCLSVKWEQWQDEVTCIDCMATTVSVSLPSAMPIWLVGVVIGTTIKESWMNLLNVSLWHLLHSGKYNGSFCSYMWSSKYHEEALPVRAPASCVGVPGLDTWQQLLTPASR